MIQTNRDDGVRAEDAEQGPQHEVYTRYERDDEAACIRDNNKWSTAIHEAAHAVIGRKLDLVCGEATIKANATGTREESLGHAHIENPLIRWQRGDGPRRPLADAFCMALCAGAEAERIFGLEFPVGDGLDQDRATACLIQLGGVPGGQYVQDDVWERYENRLRQRSRALVVQYRRTIECIAQGLLASETLLAHEIDALIRDCER